MGIKHPGRQTESINCLAYQPVSDKKVWNKKKKKKKGDIQDLRKPMKRLERETMNLLKWTIIEENKKAVRFEVAKIQAKSAKFKSFQNMINKYRVSRLFEVRQKKSMKRWGGMKRHSRCKLVTRKKKEEENGQKYYTRIDFGNQKHKA